MATRILFPSSYNARSTLCRTCLLRSLASRRHPTRSIAVKVLEKRAEAQKRWEQQAEEIRNGTRTNLWDTFKDRGFVKDIAGTDNQISELMRRKRIGAYVGIDPTAPSLHLGHLLPLMPLFWMYINGYKTISVIGGSTAKVGDPTGRLQSRERMARSDLSMNITKMHYQLKRIWANMDSQARRYGYVKEWAWSRDLYNNSQWYVNTPFTEIVNRLFKGMRLGPMLSRETVKRKMSEGDGMSLDEFVYPLMQAWDWWHLFSGPKGVMMQIGGSDQYGNIVSGIDAVKYLRDTEPDPSKKLPDDLLHTPVGFTVPLLTDSSGAKFGKSAGNAVWLDPFKTSTFDVYGYFMRRPDADVENLLKLFTFIPTEKIEKVMEEHSRDPPKRLAQHTLAYEVVTLIHGLAEADIAQRQHRQMFSKGANILENITERGDEQEGHFERDFYPETNDGATVNKAARFRVDIQLPESLILGKSISRILYAAGLATSASDGNRLAVHQGAYVGAAPGQPAANNQGMDSSILSFTPVKGWFPQDTKNFLIDGKILILRRGKHFIRVVEVVSDEEWEASGQSYHGEPNKGTLRVLKDNLRSLGGTVSKGLKIVNEAELDSAINRELDEELQTPAGSKPVLLSFPKRGDQPRAKEILLRSTIGVTLHEDLPVKAKTQLIDKDFEPAEEECGSV